MCDGFGWVLIEGVDAEDDVLSIVEAAEYNEAKVEAEVEDEKGDGGGDDALFPDKATERAGVGNETGANEEPVSGVEWLKAKMLRQGTRRQSSHSKLLCYSVPLKEWIK